MAIRIRTGNIETDRGVVIDLCSRYLNEAYDGARFDWLYRDNPAGPGRLWLAVDDRTGEVVGTAGAFPRWMSVGAHAIRAWVLGDFCMVERVRTLGPAVALQRACLEGLTSERAPLCYDFPARGMLSVYRRLGIAVTGELRRFARPLRADLKIHAATRSARLARGLSAVANAALAIGTRPPRTSRGVALAIQSDECGVEFTQLAADVNGSFGLTVRRTAEYLNWRYLRNPFQRHTIVTARRHGRLLGYVAIADASDRRDGLVVDVFATPDPRLCRHLIRGALRHCRERDNTLVNVWVPDGCEWTPALRRLGFRARETSPVVIQRLDGAVPSPASFDAARWFLTSGDRDG